MENQLLDKKEEREIDLIELGKKLWDKRSFILKISAITFVVGLVVAFSIPKEYRTTVVLAPESGSSQSSGVGALAAMAGINIGGSEVDILSSPTLYPTIAASTPFIIGLFDVNVKDQTQSINTNLYNYISDNQKSAWWSYIIALPSKLLGLFSNNNSNIKLNEVNDFNLTSAQMRVINNIKSRLEVQADKKTGVITLSVTMQSALASAGVADTLTNYLQQYIISYRTVKSRQDLLFAEKLFEEAKTNYYAAQKRYAKFLDENQNVVLASYRTNQEKLQNEVNLTFSIYNQVAQQLQMAKVKVQDNTPVYTVIQPAVVPLIPIKPNKKLIVIGFILLGVLISSGWILGKEFVTMIKK